MFQNMHFSVWHYVSGTVSTRLLSKSEAANVLEKLERFGPWTRLGKLSPATRLDELLKKAKRQLLIGLLEATSGQGFEKIIENDFANLGGQSQKRFVAIVGLATIHRLPLRVALLQRALTILGVSESVDVLIHATAGVISRSGDAVTARHQIYIEHLFERVLDNEQKAEAIHALLHGFSVYEAPLLVSVGKLAATLFKLTVNHKFLRNSFHGNEGYVLRVYEAFEKAFQSDGLFWLQYGLALRDFDRQDEALDRLRTARIAYPSLQTEHALAQQQLILARRNKRDRTLAYAMLGEAKDALMRLDARRQEFETDYPIDSLSEGHVEIARTFEGLPAARKLSGEYANILSERMRTETLNPRFRDTWKRLSVFATGGRWKAERQDAS